MLDLMTRDYRPGKGWTRRHMLRVGFLGLGGLSLADLLRLECHAAPLTSRERERPEQIRTKKETAVILVWVHGGPSHLETYDLKPEAPDEVRGPFRPIKTKSPGVEICELLPKHAAIADKFTLLRSVAHDQADHGFGTRRFLTGYADDMPGSNNGPSYYPSLECGVNRALGITRDGMPVAVNVGGFAGSPWRGPGFWGHSYQVPLIYSHNVGNGGMPNTTLNLPAGQFSQRQHLLGQLDRFRANLDKCGAMDSMETFHRRAYEIISSGRVTQAFNLSKEDPKVRDRYGSGWPQELVLARRLVESGVRFVNVYAPGLADSKAFNWDDHAVNWDMPTAMKQRLPRYDHAIVTLIDDIYERGLNENVLVIVTGEFGRTPRLEFKEGNVGRDHWPYAMSILVSGGGKQRGNVIGATDSKGAYPKTHRFDPHDFLATIYNYLGIDPHREFADRTGRPLALTRGTPIDELV
jgi:hypothetical protein